VNAAIINAGDGSHEHPTQALLDAMTIRQGLSENVRGKDLSGVKVLIVGDISHSRVARSNLIMLKTLGAEVHVCGPATLAPAALVGPGNVHFLLDDALDRVKPAVVMMLRVQQERMNSSFFPTEREYARIWGMNKSRLAKLGEKTLILHPGPMNRGLEIDAASADSPASRVLDQVRNGVSMRMAVLYSTLSGGPS
jgi:aspartate carbamoyltransferase catalytic subunit